MPIRFDLTAEESEVFASEFLSGLPWPLTASTLKGAPPLRASMAGVEFQVRLTNLEVKTWTESKFGSSPFDEYGLIRKAALSADMEILLDSVKKQEDQS